VNTIRTTTSRPRALQHLALLGLMAGALGLAACGKEEDPTVGQQIDSTIAQTEQQAAEARASAEASARQAQTGMAEAADSVSTTVRDAAITTAIKAELARDSSLSAMDINVDTEAGRVQLRGTAPDAMARDRAFALASGVDGVVAVDNELVIAPS